MKDYAGIHYQTGQNLRFHTAKNFFSANNIVRNDKIYNRHNLMTRYHIREITAYLALKLIDKSICEKQILLLALKNPPMSAKSDRELRKLNHSSNSNPTHLLNSWRLMLLLNHASGLKFLTRHHSNSELRD